MRALYCSIIIFLGIISVSAYIFFKMLPNGYVILNMNPQVKLVLNRLDEVVEVVSLNEEGHVLTADFFIDIEKTDVVIEKIIRDANALNILNDDVEVSLVFDNFSQRERVKEKVTNHLKSSLYSNQKEAYIIFDDNENIINLSKKHSISYRKAYYVYHTGMSYNDNLRDLKKEYKSSLEIQKDKIKESKGDLYFVISKNSNYERDFKNISVVENNVQIDVREKINNADEVMRSILDDGLITRLRTTIIRATRFGR